MTRQNWEEDLRQRQRNIVFPDTLRGQTNFLRMIISGRTHLNPVQRVGTLIFAFGCLSGAAIELAVFVLILRPNGDTVLERLTCLLPFMAALLSLVLAHKLAVAALFSPSVIRPPHRPKGHQHSDDF